MRSPFKSLLSVERQLNVARAFQTLKDTVPWNVISTSLKKEETTLVEELMTDPDCTPVKLARAQGVVYGLRLVTALMHMRTSRLAELETQHKLLSEKMARMPNANIPRPDAEAVEALVQDLSSSLGDSNVQQA